MKRGMWADPKFEKGHLAEPAMEKDETVYTRCSHPAIEHPQVSEATIRAITASCSAFQPIGQPEHQGQANATHGSAQTAYGTPMPNISPATVNRTTTLVLKTIIGRAKRTWRYSFPLEPIWRDHLLEEPEERVREMHDHEANALDATLRDDYWPWYEFARLTGLRRKETLLRWSNVTWNAGRQAEGIWGQISILGKNDRRVTTPITTAVKELLEALIGHNVEWVFTYVAQKTKDGRVRGARYPITKEGAKTTWRRTRAKAGITDFRFHDIRHDLATKVLRTTGNLKLTQKMLNHADIKTTARYAHVLDEEVAVALQKASESRNKSRNSTPIKAQAA